MIFDALYSPFFCPAILAQSYNKGRESHNSIQHIVSGLQNYHKKYPFKHLVRGVVVKDFLMSYGDFNYLSEPKNIDYGEKSHNSYQK